MAQSLERLYSVALACALLMLVAICLSLLLSPAQPPPSASLGSEFHIEHQGPAVSEVLDKFWRSASWVLNRTTGETRPEADVLGAIVRQIREISADTFIGETVLVHAAMLCAESEQEESHSFLVYSADEDMGQVAYMLGSRSPYSTVLALHPTGPECWRHAALLEQMRLPGGLMLHEVVSAGLWGGTVDLRHLADTPAALDVQMAIGTRYGQRILEPRTLRAVLSLSRWTLISLPLAALEDETSNPLHRALAERDADGIHIDAEIGVLGLVRVPATQEMQALFLVWAWNVERRVHGDWHQFSGEQFTVRFGAAHNATIESKAGSAETAGVLLETLIALGLPQSERASLMAAALSDVRPGPANWVVCCGGIWQWSSGAVGEELVAGSSGVVSFLACAFSLEPRATQLYDELCKECAACDQETLQVELTAEICIQCAECLAQVVAPRLLASGSMKGLPKRDSAGPVVPDFVGPFPDDVPGLGDLGNVQVVNAAECAHLCRENPRCYSFEFSPTMGGLLEQIRNCQLASSRTRAGVQFGDFALYVRRGMPGSVDERRIVVFNGQGEEEPEALSDVGRAFGARETGGVRLGWLCGNGNLQGAEAEPRGAGGAVPMQEAMQCPDGASWQISLPPGLYEVEAQVESDAEEVRCTAQGVFLEFLSEPSLPPMPPEVDVAPPQVPDAPAAEEGAAPVPLRGVARQQAMEKLFAASLGPPTVLGRADRVRVDDRGLLRLAGCAGSDGPRLLRVELRRTWQQCATPVAPIEARMAPA